MRIATESPAAPDIVVLLNEHLADMAQHSPPESVHALDLPALQASDVSFYTAREHNSQSLMGCAALKSLGAAGGELKSMRTASNHRRKGVAQALLEHIIEVAQAQQLSAIWLETGTPDAFAPARALYKKRGFVECPPFADYPDDPYSVCMRLQLDA